MQDPPQDEEAQDDPLRAAIGHVIDVAGDLMDRDPMVRSVGVGRHHQGGYEYVALRVRAAALGLRAGAVGVRRLPHALAGLPIRVERSSQGPERLATVPAGTVAAMPEQARQRPLRCGLRIQNIDHDLRTGQAAAGRMTVGSLGCFVRLGDGGIALLSNNHVIAGENAGRPGDRILQPNATAFDAEAQIAVLAAFVPLLTSPIGASVKARTAQLNAVDAALATLAGPSWAQSYVAGRPVGPLRGTSAATIDDAVYMVGSHSGLRAGTVKSVGAVVGPIGYGIGRCWFRNSFVVAGSGGLPFAAAGDSGAVVVRAVDDRVLGLVYAASPTQAWACPIDDVLAALNTTLA
jgi:hypothetical protein